MRQYGPSPSQVTPALAHIQGLMFMKLLSADGLWFICRLPFHLIPWRGHGPLGRFDLEGLVGCRVGRRNFGGIGEVFPGASLVAQRVKHLPAMWETPVQSLGQEDPLEKEMATHSSTLAWKIPWTEKPGRLQSMGWQRVGHNLATSLTSLPKDKQRLEG